MKSGSRVRVRSWNRSKDSLDRESLYWVSLISTRSGSLIQRRLTPGAVGGAVQEPRPPLPSLTSPSAAGGEIATSDDSHGGVHAVVSESTPRPQCTAPVSTACLYRARRGERRSAYHRHRLED